MTSLIKALTINRKLQAVALLAFLYGAAIHGLLIRRFVSGPDAPTDASVAGSRRVVISFIIAGGFFVAWMAMRVLRRMLVRGETRPLRILARTGLGAILATFLAEQCIYIGGATVLAWRAYQHYGGSLANALFLSILSIETYGTVEAVLDAPIAFAYGLILGAVLYFSRDRLGPWPVEVEARMS